MSNSVAIFAGPSVPQERRADWPTATWLPPARAGDILALRGQGFATVVLIDGYFDHCASPWHKELLQLMADGVALYGASSMGALRAAELDRFGMIGTGHIYRAYRSGMLSGDDEVALVHGPQSMTWKPLTVPMVEIRATLCRALRGGLLDADSARRARIAAHNIHFEDRDWPMLQRRWGEIGIDRSACEWINHNHVQLKQIDALHCIELAMSGLPKSGQTSAPPQTIFLDRLRDYVDAKAASAVRKSSSPALPLNG